MRQQILKKRRFLASCAACIAVALILILILVFVVFKPKQPRVRLLSAKIIDISNKIDLLNVKIHSNFTLNMTLQVENRNHVGFKYNSGKNFLYYGKTQVGDTDLYPGSIPARGTGIIGCKMVVLLDRLISDRSVLIKYVTGGKLVFHTKSRIPGRVRFIGVITKHVTVTSECNITVSVPQMDIETQDCNDRAKLG